jgi:hypothetical protein
VKLSKKKALSQEKRGVDKFISASCRSTESKSTSLRYLSKLIEARLCHFHYFVDFYDILLFHDLQKDFALLDSSFQD